ncbi:hypothetical protein KR018_007863, partial [Drosophila ironensis]
LVGSATSWWLSVVVLSAMVQLGRPTEYLTASEDICRLFPDGTKLRKPGSCTEWIVCQGHQRTTGGVCKDTKPYFSLSTKDCAKSVEDSYCKGPCVASSQGYVGDTVNCANWYYCEGKKQLGQGSCTNGQYFDKATQQCVYPEATVCDAKFEMCDIVPINNVFTDEDNCNKYLTCNKTFGLTVNKCEAGKYFSVASGTCIDQKLVVCSDHPVPEDVCGTKKLAVRNKFVSDRATCRGYYYCRDLGSGIPDPDPIYHQCNEDNFFNQERQACMQRETQKCSLDRCDGRDSGYEIAENEGCHNYIECVDGREETVFSCEDQYFDVELQKCTDSVKTYGACTA